METQWFLYCILKSSVSLDAFNLTATWNKYIYNRWILKVEHHWLLPENNQAKMVMVPNIMRSYFVWHVDLHLVNNFIQFWRQLGHKLVKVTENIMFLVINFRCALSNTIMSLFKNRGNTVIFFCILKSSVSLDSFNLTATWNKNIYNGWMLKVEHHWLLPENNQAKKRLYRQMFKCEMDPFPH